MKKLTFLLMATLLISFSACSSSDDNNGDLELETSKTTTIYSDDETVSGAIVFTANADWNASFANDTRATPTWIDFTPKSGGAGKYSITVEILEENTTEAERSVTIVIYCGGSKVEVTVTQKTITREEGEKGGDDDVDVSDYFNYPASKNSVEVDKKALAEEGNLFTSKTLNLRNAELYKIIEGYSDLYIGGFEFESTDKTYNMANINGVYDWSASKEEFEKKSNSDKLTLNFPEKDGGTNNCSVTAALEGSGVYYEIYSDYNEANPAPNTVSFFKSLTRASVLDKKIEIPTYVDASFSLSDKTVSTLVISVPNIKENEIPEAGKFDLNFVEGYKYYITADKVDTDAYTSSATLSEGSTNLVSINASLNATITVDEVSNYGDATATVAILDDYVVAAKADIKAIEEALEKVSGNNMSQSYCEAKAKAYNDNMTIILVSTSSKTKIADGQFVATADQWNEYEVDLMLVFPDNTKATFNSYFGTGFEDFYNTWRDFLDTYFPTSN